MDRIDNARRTILICVFLSVVTSAAYLPLFRNNFITYDDRQYVLENFHVRGGVTWPNVKWAFQTGYASNWHPLTWVSHMLDVQLFGFKPAGHHFTSLLFHVANTLLLFLLLQRMTGAVWRSAFVAAFFALHPLHVESVAWVAERKDVLSAFFGERGFLQYRWDAYTEVLAMYLLAIGSETHPIPPSSWNSFVRPMREYQGVFFLDAGAPLFVHQYSHAWFDFRGRQDRYADYFGNSVRATQAHRLFCLSYSRQFPWYTPDMWGVTASDSRDGYRIWCSPTSPPDGTLVPCAAGGSLVFLPQLCGTVLQTMFDQYGDKVWTKYGFVDAFHPKQEWFSRYVLGIDQGIMLLMAENLRSASVWTSVMSTPEARRALQATAFHPYPAA